VAELNPPSSFRLERQKNPAAPWRWRHNNLDNPMNVDRKPITTD